MLHSFNLVVDPHSSLKEVGSKMTKRENSVLDVVENFLGEDFEGKGERGMLMDHINSRPIQSINKLFVLVMEPNKVNTYS